MQLNPHQSHIYIDYTRHLPRLNCQLNPSHKIPSDLMQIL